MDGFKDLRTAAELLLAPKKPLSRNLTGLSSLKLNLGGTAAPGVVSDLSQVAGPIRTTLTSAIKNTLTLGAISTGITAVLGSFDAQVKTLSTNPQVPTGNANGIPSTASFFSFSSLAPGAKIPATFQAIIQQRKQQLQQLAKAFASTLSSTKFAGVSLLENTTPKPYPLQEDVDRPDVPRLAQGGSAAQADAILKDKIKFAVQGVTIGAGKPNFWARLVSAASVAAVPTLSATVNQIFKDRKNSGTWSEPTTKYAAQFPYNHVQQTESGHVIEMDDTPGAERVHVFHRSGSFIEMHPNGDIVYKSMRNGYSITMADQHVKVTGNCHVAVDGNSTLYVKGNAEMQVDGDINVQAKGDYNVHATNINLKAKQTFSGDGTTIDLRYISLPFSIMPVSYGLAPIGFAPRVNLGAVLADLGTDLQHMTKIDPKLPPAAPPPLGLLPSTITVPPDNPLSNFSVYTDKTPEAVSYRSKLFDTPEEVNDLELYAAHVGLQKTLTDTDDTTRQLGGKLTTTTTTVPQAQAKPTVNYLDFSTFKGTYVYANNYQLANTTFVLSDLSDLALHPTVVQDTLAPGSSTEGTPADLQTSFPPSAGITPVVVAAPPDSNTPAPVIISPPDFNVAVFGGASSIQPPNVLYSNGTVILDGAVLETPNTFSSPYTLNFTAKFDGGAFQHIGFALDLHDPPWAIISTGPGDGIYARTNPTVGVAVDTLIGTTALYGVSHDFTIEWSVNGFKYYIGGVLKATHNLPETTPMKILGSDSSQNGNVITITVLDELTL